jgi:hypothetical protein
MVLDVATNECKDCDDSKCIVNGECVTKPTSCVGELTWNC